MSDYGCGYDRTVAALLVVVLIIIKGVLKPIMKKAGEENQDFYSGLYKWIDQSVMGIKEIKVANKESYFINEYCKCGAGYVSAVQRYNLYNATPRLLIETVAIAGMILYMMVRIAQGTPVTEIMPQLTTLAVAAMRLIPSANRINNYLTSIAYFEPFFMGVTDNLQRKKYGMKAWIITKRFIGRKKMWKNFRLKRKSC